MASASELGLQDVHQTGFTDPSTWGKSGPQAFFSGQIGYDNAGNYYGLNPKNNQWTQLYATTGSDSEGKSLEGYYFADDPNKPANASPWTHSDPGGLYRALSIGVPIGLAAIGAGAAGAFGGAGSGAAEGAMSASPQGLNPALIGSGGPGLSPAYAGGGVGLNPVTGGAAFNAALSPALQAALAGSPGLPSAIAASPITGQVPQVPAIAPQGGGSAAAGGGASASQQGLAAPGAGSSAAGSAPSLGSAAAPSAAGAAGTGNSTVDGILAAMRKNAGLMQLGVSGLALGMAASKPAIPNEQQINELAATGSQAAKDLISSYRSGQLSAAQQAQMDQATQNARNQIKQYFASIGQSDSTAAMQAMQMVDQQALQMRQQMLDNMLQQGLQALGAAQGPLNTVAQYQLGQDKELINALGNFAGSVGQAFGREPAKPQGGTPSTAAGQTGEITGQETTSIQ